MGKGKSCSGRGGQGRPPEVPTALDLTRLDGEGPPEGANQPGAEEAAPAGAT